jgi:predicted  nucleic acid-binding Zn-ribbon protein
MQQYREVARIGMALLMPDMTEDEHATPQESWSWNSAKHDLFARIAQEEPVSQSYRRERVKAQSHLRTLWSWLYDLALPPVPRYAAVIVLLAVAILAVYQVSARKRQELRTTSSQIQAESSSEQTYLKKLIGERAALDRALKAKAAEVHDLSEQVKIQTAEVAKWKALQSKTARELSQQASAMAGLQFQYASSVTDREAINRKIQESQAALQIAQNRYDALRDQRSVELPRVASLESRIQDLSGRLSESEATVQQQQQLLAHDHDVRELMGARNLYIADVYDVARSGETQEPYGRVFYTTGKSLIFYAFDLDQQPNLRRAGIFQAWGRHGMTDRRPLNMGVFYLDSAANNRWVLKFDDPKALAQIDAVFVTAEPHGGSQKPSGKQLLFASLRMVATNHP